MGNLQVRFLEGWAPAMAPGYSTIIKYLAAALSEARQKRSLIWLVVGRRLTMKRKFKSGHARLKNKARPSRFGARQDRCDRKLEVVRIAAQLSAFDR